MARISATRVRCPRPEHAGSRVKLDGATASRGIVASATSARRVGVASRMCSPSSCRGRSHGWALPSIVSERSSGVWPEGARHYQFVARGIAEALLAVGAGSSYMRASRVSRDRARRFRFDGETGELRESDHGQLVADLGGAVRAGRLCAMASGRVAVRGIAAA
jgi:hypothetical protein